MVNKKRRILTLTRFFTIVFLIYLSIMVNISLHITPKGIVYNMGDTCENSILITESDKILMDETYKKLIQYPELIKKYGHHAEFFLSSSQSPKIYKALNLDWNKLFSYSYDTSIQIRYKSQYKYNEIKKNILKLNMIDSFVLDGGCRYIFVVDRTNPFSYQVKINWREAVATITSNGVKREYFLKFPNFLEEWLK